MLRLLLFLTVIPTASAKDVLIVAEGITNTLTFVDMESRTALGQIPLGQAWLAGAWPQTFSFTDGGIAENQVHGVTLDKDKRLLAVTAMQTNSVSLINLENGRMQGRAAVGRGPHVVAFTPDNKFIWVPNVLENFISVVEVKSMTEVKRLPVKFSPVHIYFPPDEGVAYVAYYALPVVDVIDIRSGKLLTSINLNAKYGTTIFQVTPSKKEIWVPLQEDGKIVRIDAKTRKEIEMFRAGVNVMHATFRKEPGGDFAYVAAANESNINKIAYQEGKPGTKIVASYRVGGRPHGVYLSPDNSVLWVTLEFGDKVVALSADDLRELGRVSVGRSPKGAVVAQLSDKQIEALRLVPVVQAEMDSFFWQSPLSRLPLMVRVVARDIGYGTMMITAAGYGLTEDRLDIYTESDTRPIMSIQADPRAPSSEVLLSVIEEPGRLMRDNKPMEKIYVMKHGEKLDPENAHLVLSLQDGAQPAPPRSFTRKIRDYIRNWLR